MEDTAPVSSFPGINRIQYFLITLVFGFFWGFSVGLTGADSTATSVMNLLAIVGIFIATVFRLHSIGVSRWFAIISLVPVANVIFGIFSQCAQPAYAGGYAAVGGTASNCIRNLYGEAELHPK